MQTVSSKEEAGGLCFANTGCVDFISAAEVGVRRKGVKGFDLQFHSAIQWLLQMTAE